jgi:hypothetical protein
VNPSRFILELGVVKGGIAHLISISFVDKEQHMNLLAKYSLVAVLAAAAPFVAAQSVYVWKDDAGRNVYSDTPPPPSVPRSRILKSPNISAAAAPAAAPAGDAKGRNAEAAEKTKAANEKSADEKDSAQRCTELRNQLASLQSGQRMSRTNDKGEREVLDDSARAQMAERTQADIAKTCK